MLEGSVMILDFTEIFYMRIAVRMGTMGENKCWEIFSY